MDKTELERLRSFLKITSSLSTLELPALIVAALALIPGVIDEAILGVGAIAVFAVLALGRRHIARNRDHYLSAIEEAFKSNQIDHKEHAESIKALNTLTVEGGKDQTG